MLEGKPNMHHDADAAIFKRAEELRNNMTPAEELLWEYLKDNQWQLKFRRQHPILFYVADFYCHALKLVIELDGSIHDDQFVKAYDDAREVELKSLGLTILRFTNKEVFSNIEYVLNEIEKNIKKIEARKIEY
jgi:very-short-patch-repair endonuclease